MQLMGIAATLVLLGVPWIFSAFGVIDAAHNDGLRVVEGVCQVDACDSQVHKILRCCVTSSIASHPLHYALCHLMSQSLCLQLC